jgi:lysophospholipase L1-like esterase
MKLARRFALLFTALCLFLADAPVARTADDKPQNTAVKPDQRKDKGAIQRHEAFLERAKKGKVEVLFLGDSITQGWESKEGLSDWKSISSLYKTANFGIGSDRTQHVLWRITEGKELEGIKPEVIVLMIGTNNMGDNSAEEIADGVTAIVKELNKQLPKARVLLFGIFPRSAKATDPVRDKIKECNKRIAKLDDGKLVRDGMQVRYLDIGEKFLDKDGNLPKEIMPDYLHLSKKGYQIWKEAVLDGVGKILIKKE